MVNKTLVLSIIFVVCGLLMLAYGFTVAYWIAENPKKGPSFYWDYVPTYARLNISGGLPLITLGLTLGVSGALMGLNRRNMRSNGRPRAWPPNAT